MKNSPSRADVLNGFLRLGLAFGFLSRSCSCIFSIVIMQRQSSPLPNLIFTTCQDQTNANLKFQARKQGTPRRKIKHFICPWPPEWQISPHEPAINSGVDLFSEGQ